MYNIIPVFVFVCTAGSDVVPIVDFTADNALEDASLHFISGFKGTLDPLLKTPVIL